MEQQRQLIFYKHHFREFFDPLNEKVKEKIDQVLFTVCLVERIPSKFFRSLAGFEGLFEIRIEYKSNIYRIFCCFDEGNLVVLFNGFQKKSRKTPKKEIEKAMHIKQEYFELKNKSK